MPRHLPTVCDQPGCPNYPTASAKRCPDHAPRPWAGSTRRRRDPPGWAKIRTAILRRDKGICQIRYEGICTVRATEVDHIVPTTYGGSSEPANLQAACTPCNKQKNYDDKRAHRSGTQG